jgi:hypothetical protein
VSPLTEMLEQPWNGREGGPQSSSRNRTGTRMSPSGPRPTTLTERSFTLREEAGLRHQFDCRVGLVVHAGPAAFARVVTPPATLTRATEARGGFPFATCKFAL